MYVCMYVGGSFFAKCIVLCPSSLRVRCSKIEGHFIRFCSINNDSHSCKLVNIQKSGWIIYPDLLFKFSLILTTENPMSRWYYQKISYCRNSRWKHVDTFLNAFWIHFRVFYSIISIRNTNIKRFKKKMKLISQNRVSRSFASSPPRTFRAPSTINVGVP